MIGDSGLMANSVATVIGLSPWIHSAPMARAAQLHGPRQHLGPNREGPVCGPGPGTLGARCGSLSIGPTRRRGGLGPRMNDDDTTAFRTTKLLAVVPSGEPSDGHPTG